MTALFKKDHTIRKVPGGVHSRPIFEVLHLGVYVDWFKTRWEAKQFITRRVRESKPPKGGA